MMHMNVRPLGDRVIVKPLSKEEVTASGIIIPDTVDKERPEQGEVLAVGPGRRMENGERATMDLKVGDKIVFKKYSPDEIEIDKEELLVISESDVMAVLE
jgi:chaperonin GroES